MIAATILAAVMLAGLVLYALFDGADYWRGALGPVLCRFALKSNVDLLRM